MLNFVFTFPAILSSPTVKPITLMEKNLICMTIRRSINSQEELISLGKAMYQDSFWNG